MKHVLFAFVGIIVLALVVVLASDSGQKTPEAASATAVPHYQAAELRRVVIVPDAQVSRGQDPVLVQLIDGAIPSGVTQLLVLTDQNCVPDADGVSHCINQVRFITADGVGEATLQHHHRMAEEPCLAPGETIALVA